MEKKSVGKVKGSTTEKDEEESADEEVESEDSVTNTDDVKKLEMQTLLVKTAWAVVHMNSIY